MHVKNNGRTLNFASTVCIAILQVDQHTEQATDEYHSAVQST
jgi:hypothetical protein